MSSQVWLFRLWCAAVAVVMVGALVHMLMGVDRHSAPPSKAIIAMLATALALAALWR